MKKKERDYKEFMDMVVREGNNGNVVVMTIEGPMMAKLDEFIKQPMDGLLYDLNRLPEVALSIARKDPRWINDYAVALVIRRLKQMVDDKPPAPAKKSNEPS